MTPNTLPRGWEQTIITMKDQIKGMGTTKEIITSVDEFLNAFRGIFYIPPKQ